MSILKKIKRCCYTCCICGAIPRDFHPSSCLVPIKLQVPRQNHWNILEILLTLQCFKCLVILQRRNVISTTQRLVLHFMAFPVFFFWQGTYSYMAAHFNGFKKTVLRSVDFSAFSFFFYGFFVRTLKTLKDLLTTIHWFNIKGHPFDYVNTQFICGYLKANMSSMLTSLFVGPSFFEHVCHVAVTALKVTIIFVKEFL